MVLASALEVIDTSHCYGSQRLILQVPGDGREFVVTDARACKIRAEDGRRVECVDISPFISNLPYGQPFLQSCRQNHKQDSQTVDSSCLH